MRTKIAKRSIEYMDNRLSLYCAQYGKCSITGRMLEYDEIHCHHKVPRKLGGGDEYANLTIVHTDVHTLIHAVKPDTVAKYLQSLNLDSKNLKKLNKLCAKAGNEPIAA